MSLPKIIEQIQQAAKKVLAEGKAELVIGYRAGTAPMTLAPVFCRSEDDCNQLTWSAFAKINLATYLSKIPGKVAIVAKGCDARNAVGMVNEKQISRENLYVIGVACGGMVDVQQIINKETRPIISVEEDMLTIQLKGEGWSNNFTKTDVLRRNCKTCICRSPKDLADEMLGEFTEPLAGDDFADLKALAGKSAAEKMAYFKALVKECLRCYACRNACPLCYCPVCFVDETLPQWLGKSQDEMDTYTFHILRAFHCAGRCTACGACEASCPMDIKLREFNRILEEEVQNDWQYVPGLSWEQKAPLTTYRQDDDAEFIK